MADCTPMPTSLSDAKVRNAKPGKKPYKISDGEGLFLMPFMFLLSKNLL